MMQNPFENVFSTLFGQEIRLPAERQKELINTAYNVVNVLEGLTKDEMHFVLVSVAKASSELLTVTTNHTQIVKGLDKVLALEANA